MTDADKLARIAEIVGLWEGGRHQNLEASRRWFELVNPEMSTTSSVNAMRAIQRILEEP